MTRAQATTYATRALRVGMGGHFKGHSKYSVTCSYNSTSSRLCFVEWTRGSFYSGTVKVYYLIENGELVWGDHYRIRKLQSCNSRCFWRTYRG